MSLYYNESHFVNEETILDSAHFNPMSEAISLSCVQVIDEGNQNEADIGIMFDMVSSGANVCCAFTEDAETVPKRRYSTETIYDEVEDCVTFRFIYIGGVNGKTALIDKLTDVWRDATWSTTKIAYQLTAINDN